MRGFIRELLEAAALFLVIFLVLHFSIRNFRIDGPSMHPSMVDEQHVIVSKIAYSRFSLAPLANFSPFTHASDESGAFLTSHPPEYGDVIAFIHPRDTSRALVKRVIGLPGDVIEIEDGQVIRNGERLDEPYVVHSDTRSFAPVVVSDGSYYVLGDNRLVSSDSRDWGLAPEEHIIGRAWLSYWPLDRIEFLSWLW